MKVLKLFFTVVCTALLSASFVACDDKDEPNPGNEQQDDTENEVAVTVTAGIAKQNSLSFTVTPTNAETCAWACIEEGEAIPTAEEILANKENVVNVTEATKVEVANLKSNTKYTIVAAASKGTTTVLSKQVSMLTISIDAIVMEGCQVVLSGGWGSEPRDAGLTFWIGDAPDSFLTIPVLFDNQYRYLPAGTYPVNDSGEAGTANNANTSDITIFYYNGAEYAITDGTMNIELKDEVYNIDFEFNTEDDSFRVIYKGKIEGMAFFFDLSTLSTARRTRVKGEADGEYSINFLDNELTTSLTLDFFADPTSTTLPAGTYTVSTGTTPNSIGPASELSITNPKSTYTFATGTVVVTKSNDDIYTFDINLADATGYEYKGKFTGKIANMVRDENDPDDVTIIDMTRAKYAITWVQGNSFCCTFVNDSSNAKEILGIDVAVDNSEKRLTAGTYTVSDSHEPFTIYKDSKGTYLSQYFPGETTSTKESILEGTMTVAVDGNVYDIVMDLTVESGKYRCIYKGTFPWEEDN
ncbi:MAG: hypothetical protein K2M94_06935 [Paramuribaculum sp.]|nr:hypothetical protein [Paramuribaculum sp.]